MIIIMLHFLYSLYLLLSFLNRSYLFHIFILFTNSDALFSFPLYKIFTLYSTLGRSDMEFFSIFKNRHYSMLPIRYIFMRQIPTNRQIWPRGCAAHGRGQSFHFKKITRLLKINIFLKICK